MRLNPDESFHLELFRNFSHARCKGADIAEVLEAAGQLKGTDMESFYQAFIVLAERVDRQAQAIDGKRHPVSAHDAFFQASTHSRAADFYLHGKPDDLRISTLWESKQMYMIRQLLYCLFQGECCSRRQRWLISNSNHLYPC